jgi:putative heme-binding domain-containing protein
LRRHYLGWFQKKRDHAAHRPELAQYFRDVGLTYNDGISVIPYLENFLDENVATLSAAERQELALYLPKPPPADATPSGRQFVKHWRMADLEPDLGMLQWRRSRARGRSIFREARCQLCHRFDGLGGLVGPDLTAVGSRMAGREILDSVIEPSKVLPEQYQNTLLTLRDGNVLEGRVVEENERRLVLMTDLIARSRVEILKPDVKSRRLSRISPMPEGLLDALTETEIWDLIAYLESAGKPASAALQKN